MTRVRFGRFGETAMWILVALGSGPRPVARLLDEVRSLDGPVGPGTLYAAVARLERVALIERTTNADGIGAYRLTPRISASAFTANRGATS